MNRQGWQSLGGVRAGNDLSAEHDQGGDGHLAAFHGRFGEGQGLAHIVFGGLVLDVYAMSFLYLISSPSTPTREKPHFFS